MNIKPIMVFVLFLFKAILYIIIGVVTIIYIQTNIYDFYPNPKFSGKEFYNPYQNWDKLSKVKANFHAHSKAWAGITDGHNSPSEIYSYYQKIGYKMAAVSNYHSPDFSHLPTQYGLFDIPVYEHGNNIKKSHKLAINPTKVSYLDFPFEQNTSQKQQIINILKKNGGMVCIAHPGLKDGHTEDDMKTISGYRFIEAVNPHNLSLDRWDVALRHHHISWIFADDDTHDLVNEPAGHLLNIVGVNKIYKTNFLQALIAGSNVAVKTDKGKIDVFLKRLNLAAGKINYEFEGNAKKVKIIENGALKQVNFGNMGSVSLSDSTQYVRLEIEGTESTLYTNPIIRSESSKTVYFKDVPPTINFLKTWLYRIIVFLVATVSIYLISKINI